MERRNMGSLVERLNGTAQTGNIKKLNYIAAVVIRNMNCL
jgi:hypothetical protein